MLLNKNIVWFYEPKMQVKLIFRTYVNVNLKFLESYLNQFHFAPTTRPAVMRHALGERKNLRRWNKRVTLKLKKYSELVFLSTFYI